MKNVNEGLRLSLNCSMDCEQLHEMLDDYQQKNSRHNLKKYIILWLASNSEELAGLKWIFLSVCCLFVCFSPAAVVGLEQKSQIAKIRIISILFFFELGCKT